MKLNAKSEYALRAMVDLASRPGEQTTLEEIAERQQIPPAILPGIVQTLSKAGLVDTVRGYGGGVRLARPAAQVNARMVLEALEGPLHLYRCESARGPCDLGLGRRCPLRALWDKTQSEMLEVWERTTLADLAAANGSSLQERATKGSRRSRALSSGKA